MSRVFVTASPGPLGNHLLRQLFARAFAVRALARSHATPGPEAISLDGATTLV